MSPAAASAYEILAWPACLTKRFTFGIPSSHRQDVTAPRAFVAPLGVPPDARGTDQSVDGMTSSNRLLAAAACAHHQTIVHVAGAANPASIGSPAVEVNLSPAARARGSHNDPWVDDSQGVK